MFVLNKRNILFSKHSTIHLCTCTLNLINTHTSPIRMISFVTTN